MDEKTVVITERNGNYRIQNNGMSDFALLGILGIFAHPLEKD